MRIFSGIQPTGRKHLGNFLGAIVQYVESQERGEVKHLRFEIPDAIKRVEKEGDLFEPVLKLKQRLPGIGELDAD